MAVGYGFLSALTLSAYRLFLFEFLRFNLPAAAQREIGQETFYAYVRNIVFSPTFRTFKLPLGFGHQALETGPAERVAARQNLRLFVRVQANAASELSPRLRCFFPSLAMKATA